MKRKQVGWGRGPSFKVLILQVGPAIALCVLFSAVGVLHVTSRIRVVNAGYRLSELENENHDLMHQNDRLKLELSTLKNPGRLEHLAREQLKMVPLSSQSMITAHPRGGILTPTPMPQVADRGAGLP